MRKVTLDEETAKAIKPLSSSPSSPLSTSSEQLSKSSSRPSLENEGEDVQHGPPRLLPQELMGILIPSLKVGAAGGACGLFAGATAGIIRTNIPVIYSLHTGWQWFALSSSFYGSRQIALKALRGNEEIRPADKVKASAMAGGFAGMIGGLIRGPRNILPGAVVFSLFGAGGQAAMNSYYRRRELNPEKKGGGFLASKWSPVTPLSDQEYEAMLEEKLLRVEAEMAIIDDQINELRAVDAKKVSQRTTEEAEPKSA